jgi:hypothetical protein
MKTEQEKNILLRNSLTNDDFDKGFKNYLKE